ncbi:hypothetical protein DOTSEDRAFT_71160 [Dothistroma septosporum NZE10]|uniref:Uncharacterized protein n=1 Tax=Dothistroma septosporum (strain NZE10 / CBS 128990) TaxID=675120 RepID=N1PQW9_DOTSN|nr:hypothetical protein DOTSEDRAFT_71160 [Dothistroma septosporum NZE10]
MVQSGRAKTCGQALERSNRHDRPTFPANLEDIDRLLIERGIGYRHLSPRSALGSYRFNGWTCRRCYQVPGLATSGQDQSNSGLERLHLGSTAYYSNEPDLRQVSQTHLD